MMPFFRLKSWTRQLPIIAIFLLMIFVQLWEGAIVELPRDRLDGLIYDLKVRHLPPWPDSVTNIQIVDIDEYSLATVGRMPWSRQWFTKLTDTLRQKGAVVIAYDVLFSEPQTTLAGDVLAQIEKLTALEQNQKDSVLEVFNYDLHFARSIASTEVVLPMLLHRSVDGKTNQALRVGKIDSLGVEQNIPAQKTYLHQYPGYAAPISAFADAASGQGFMNSFEDADGFVRRVALLAQVDGKLYPSLALEAFRVYSLADSVKPLWEVHKQQAYLTGVQVGNVVIPTDDLAQVFIPYRGKNKTYPYTSAADLLNGEINDDRFDQAIVFIGTSATGLADLRATPVELGFPGVEIQANVFDALQSPDAIPYQPEWWREAMLVQLALIVILCPILLTNRTPFFTLMVTSLILIAVIAANLICWYVFYLYLPLVSPLFLAIFIGTYYISSGFILENRQRRRVKAVFDQYVPPAHIDRLLNEPDSVSLSGEKKELSVMFSDIRSFTSISESMTAGDLKLWLNQFFSPITQTILLHDGTIDKYVGDMVMAFWGAPLDEPKHASKSIKAAFAMLEQLEVLNHSFSQNNQPSAFIGIGINTGEMNVGDMGSDFRRAYTVIGDAVNLGSRLEGLTKFYAVDILVSQATFDQAPEFEYWLIDKVKVKGKVQPVTIYAPVSHKAADSVLVQVKRFNNIMQLYFTAQFDLAMEMIEQIDNPEFANPHLLGLYKERVAHFIANPPEADWDGSFTHTSK